VRSPGRFVGQLEVHAVHRGTAEARTPEPAVAVEALVELQEAAPVIGYLADPTMVTVTVMPVALGQDYDAAEFGRPLATVTMRITSVACWRWRRSTAGRRGAKRRRSAELRARSCATGCWRLNDAGPDAPINRKAQHSADEPRAGRNLRTGRPWAALCAVA
jgi:hypothetical protein